MEIEKYIVADDRGLVEMSLNGDSYAFEHLFDRYRESILQVYRLRTAGNRDDADDLLQETFVKVYLNLEKYDPRFTFGQWLFTIARNTFIDFVRKKRDELSLDNVGDGFTNITPAASEPTPEERIINSQQRAQLERFLDTMPAKYKKLVLLRFFRDYSYEEIAEELNLPMGTVKTQIHRAREQLCKMIRAHDDSW